MLSEIRIEIRGGETYPYRHDLPDFETAGGESSDIFRRIIPCADLAGVNPDHQSIFPVSPEYLSELQLECEICHFPQAKARHYDCDDSSSRLQQ